MMGLAIHIIGTLYSLRDAVDVVCYWSAPPKLGAILEVVNAAPTVSAVIDSLGGTIRTARRRCGLY